MCYNRVGVKVEVVGFIGENIYIIYMFSLINPIAWRWGDLLEKICVCVRVRVCVRVLSLINLHTPTLYVFSNKSLHPYPIIYMFSLTNPPTPTPALGETEAPSICTINITHCGAPWRWNPPLDK